MARKFFLYSPEAIAAAQKSGNTAWQATFSFHYGNGVYGNDPTYPRGAVAFSGEAMRRLIDKSGHLTMLLEAQLTELAGEASDLIAEFAEAIKALEAANLAENQPEDLAKHAEFMRDTVIPAMGAVREAADKLEKIVADDLWPLPKYSEILFIK